ncbi:MbtH family protein [Sphaerimonospora cavernae]|uniref:MbtH family protein n=1 Tax=Sphaerimonospora cavernae TaxID=1740611 RepID=A0ABV6U078_9ACTN
MFSDENQILRVVVNDEEQHSIWPVGRNLPPGWRATGFEGVKAECLEHIDAVWPDIRPLSVRQRLSAVSEEVRYAD